MADMSDMTPDELNEYLKSIGKADLPQSGVDLTEFERAQQAVSGQNKPLGKLGDVLSRAKLEKAIRPPETGFQLVGGPESRDFTLVGEPVGGSLVPVSEQRGLVPSGVVSTTGKTLENLGPEESIFSKLMGKVSAAGSKVGSTLDKVPGLSKALKYAGPLAKGLEGAAVGDIASGEFERNAEDLVGYNRAPSAQSYSGQIPLPAWGDAATAQSTPTQPTTQTPSDTGMDEEEFNKLADEEGTPSKSVSPIVAQMQKYKDLQKSPTPNARPVSDVLASLLGNKDDGLKSAQDQRNQLQLLAMLGKAGSTIGHAFTPLAQTPDQSFYNQLLQGANQPVEDVKTAQALKGEKISEQMKMRQLLTEAQKTDPTSSVSNIAREFYEKTMHKPADANLSAADLEKMEPSLMRMFNAEQGALNRKAMTEAAREQKDTQQKSKAAEKVDAQLEAARMAPSAKLAEADYYNAQKVLDIKKRFGDINNITTDMLPVLITEMGKVASGGVPHKEQLERMMPETAISKIQGWKGKVLNEAQAADAKGFLKNYFNYVEDIQDGAKKTITDRYGRILKTAKSRLSPEDYATRQDTYMNRFNNEDNSPKPFEPSKPKTVIQNGHTYTLNEKTGQYE